MCVVGCIVYYTSPMIARQMNKNDGLEICRIVIPVALGTKGLERMRIVDW